MRALSRFEARERLRPRRVWSEGRSGGRLFLNVLANCADALGSVFLGRREGNTETMRRAFPRMTLSERSRYTRWWIEHSGLSRDELVDIAIGLGGDAPSAGVVEATSDRQLFRGGSLAPAETKAGHDNVAA